MRVLFLALLICITALPQTKYSFDSQRLASELGDIEDVAVLDLSGDGKPDVLTCVEWSVYPFFSHAAIEMKQRPRVDLGSVEVVVTEADTP